MEKGKMNLCQKIINIRRDFASAEISKSGENPFAHYRYFELGDFIPQAIDLCHKYGVLPLVSFTDSTAVMTIFDADTGETMGITSPMADAQLKGCSPIQAIGAAETYSRRYLWMAFLEIVESDGLEAVTGNEPQKTQTAQAKTTAPANAPKKDERPASTFNGMNVWKAVLDFYGYDYKKPKDDKDNADAMKAAHALFDPYAKSPSELTEPKGKAIMDRLENMRESNAVGPEDFIDDSADLIQEGA